MRIAVLLTSYNRKKTTLASLARLFMQKCEAELVAFVVDDNSPDGTYDAVASEFPKVRLLRGSGDLFWCGGMRMAFEAALAEDFDQYLWLNDDTILDPDALARLLATYRALNDPTAILVGSTRDSTTGALTYGGVVRSSRVHPMKFKLVPPADHPQECETINGNCVLIPREAAALVKNLSSEFRHAIGDFDYGLRARKLGCRIYVAPGFYGTCSTNSDAGTFRDRTKPLSSRWKHLTSNKGLPPGEYLIYVRRHGGPLWPIFWAMPYVRTVVSSVFRRN